MKAEESTRWAPPTACGWGGGVCGGQEPAFFFLIFTYLATSDLCSMQASCYGQEAQLPCDM